MVYKCSTAKCGWQSPVEIVPLSSWRRSIFCHLTWVIRCLLFFTHSFLFFSFINFSLILFFILFRFPSEKVFSPLFCNLLHPYVCIHLESLRNRCEYSFLISNSHKNHGTQPFPITHCENFIDLLSLHETELSITDSKKTHLP